MFAAQDALRLARAGGREMAARSFDLATHSSEIVIRSASVLSAHWHAVAHQWECELKRWQPSLKRWQATFGRWQAALKGLEDGFALRCEVVVRKVLTRREAIKRNGLFGLKLTASMLAGALVTVAAFSPRPSKVIVIPAEPEIAVAGASGQSVLYRNTPPRQERARGWEAEAIQSDRAPPINFPRAVKTVRITPPAQPDVTAAAEAPTVVAAATPGASIARASVAPMGKASDVKSWRYQLQGVNPATIANSSTDLVVIDYAGENGPFSRAEVEQMQRKPDGSRRVVLSYMSIGEAENYRWYWATRSSTWLGPENPKWKGNYGVRFWHDDWQKIIFEYTDKIIAAGFDGVYLDKVDEYEEMGHKDDMVEFVSRIAARAKEQRPDFLVVSQNGDQLIPNRKFRQAIDAFAREDLYYGENADGVRNSASSIRESVARLKMLTAEGKPVFVVEYPRNEDQAKTAKREIADQGFVGLMARRALDALER